METSLLSFVDCQKDTFYYLKGIVFPGLMVVQVEAMIRESEYSKILMGSDDADCDCSIW